jgi:hypothetical protein
LAHDVKDQVEALTTEKEAYLADWASLEGKDSNTQEHNSSQKHQIVDLSNLVNRLRIEPVKEVVVPEVVLGYGLVRGFCVKNQLLGGLGSFGVLALFTFTTILRCP